MLKAVLFDLDGTLAPMDQNIFVKTYFEALANKLVPHGYDKEKFIQTVWLGTRAMVKNDGSVTNEKAFWNFFTSVYGQESLNHLPVFEDFYYNDFPALGAKICTPDPDAFYAVKYLKDNGIKVCLATNPLFPKMATEARIRWAGFEPSDFESYTTYENSRYCKPNIKYYEDVINSLGLKSDECIMVGNDASEDTVATLLGMKVFLITKFLINKDQKDISIYPQGDFNNLIQYINGLI